MRTVTAEEAERKLQGLLDEVARGETITIVREGVPVATLAPAKERRDVDRAIEDLRRLRKEVGGKPVTVEEIREMIEEGRRF